MNMIRYESVEMRRRLTIIQYNEIAGNEAIEGLYSKNNFLWSKNVIKGDDLEPMVIFLISCTVFVI